MERLSDKNPCNNCTVDKQIGNPYRHQCECDRCLKPGRWKDECVKKLKDYEDLEEQGRLLKLEDIYQKVMIGQEVWIITVNNNVSFAQISRINECWSDLLGFQGEYCAIPKKGRGGWDFKYKDFGKTVFLTHQEAEDKLAEMEGKKCNLQ